MPFLLSRPRSHAIVSRLAVAYLQSITWKNREVWTGLFHGITGIWSAKWFSHTDWIKLDATEEHETTIRGAWAIGLEEQSGTLKNKAG